LSTYPSSQIGDRQKPINRKRKGKGKTRKKSKEKGTGKKKTNRETNRGQAKTE